MDHEGNEINEINAMDDLREILPDEAQQQQQEHENRLALTRSQIHQQAGDQSSLLGTTADATQVLLFALCTLTTHLAKAKNLADVRAATASIAPMAAAFLKDIETGEVKMPFMAKGLESVVADIKQRATQVSNVLESAQKGEL